MLAEVHGLSVLVTWTGTGAVARSDLWYLTICMLRCVVLAVPAGTVCGAVWVWIRAAA